MNLLQWISRTKAAQEATGFLFASYLKLVKHTTRPVIEPPDAYAHMDPLLPVILAMWHGQHFMVPLALRPQDRASSLVSRSPDGELNAIVLRHLGIEAVRGSGARGRNFLEKGGVVAFEGLLKALAGERPWALPPTCRRLPACAARASSPLPSSPGARSFPSLS